MSPKGRINNIMNPSLESQVIDKNDLGFERVHHKANDQNK